jgi:hypothetical protein
MIETDKMLKGMDEVKCDEGHLLTKENAFFCQECDRKYYPENEVNTFEGYEKARKASILDNMTTSFIFRNEEGTIVK